VERRIVIDRGRHVDPEIVGAFLRREARFLKILSEFSQDEQASDFTFEMLAIPDTEARSKHRSHSTLSVRAGTPTPQERPLPRRARPTD
jgi:hypothetical protein